MSRIHICKACQNEKYGIKTRIAVPHTCDKGAMIDNKKFNDWLDNNNMRNVDMPLHLKFMMYKNQTKKPNIK